MQTGRNANLRALGVTTQAVKNENAFFLFPPGLFYMTARKSALLFPECLCVWIVKANESEQPYNNKPVYRAQNSLVFLE